jgi:hypothetical protein
VKTIRATSHGSSPHGGVDPSFSPTLQGIAMSSTTVSKLLSEFDDLASKSDDVNVQFLIRAMKLHAELMNSRLGALEQAMLTLLKK